MKISKKKKKLFHDFYTLFIDKLTEMYPNTSLEVIVDCGCISLCNKEWEKFIPIMGEYITEYNANMYGFTDKGKDLLNKWTQEMCGDIEE